jgi:Raf kinase inhibitor-like YbhB/YbcL family protein
MRSAAFTVGEIVRGRILAGAVASAVLLGGCSSTTTASGSPATTEGGAGGSAGIGAASGAASSGGTASGGAASGGASSGGARGLAGGAGGGHVDAGTGTLALQSVAFRDGTQIAAKYRCVAPSPDLTWSGAPAGTRSFAIVFQDVTPGFSKNFLHWVMYDIASSVAALPEGVAVGYAPAAPAGAHQAPIWNNTLGFNGPCAPSGKNTYELTLYALDTAALPGVPQGTAGAAVVTAIQAHQLSATKLTVTSVP